MVKRILFVIVFVAVAITMSATPIGKDSICIKDMRYYPGIILRDLAERNLIDHFQCIYRTGQHEPFISRDAVRRVFRKAMKLNTVGLECLLTEKRTQAISDSLADAAWSEIIRREKGYIKRKVLLLTR